MIKIIKKDEKGETVELPITKSILFPGGEVGIQLDDFNLKYRYTKAPYQTIIARIMDSNDILRLLNVVDALRRDNDTPIRLFMPYVPYSRQDRACNAGEAFSLKVFANLINAQNFKDVTICDPHSDVVPAVFNNVKVISQLDIIDRFAAFRDSILKGASFIAPDSGANKKTSNLAAYFGHAAFLRADKLRDLDTGNIKETLVYADDLSGQTVVIVDDICDGGRTFIELAKVLKSKNASKVVLYVTHGIFSKGVKPLFEGGIDEIYTTNAYNNTNPVNIDGKLTVFDLENSFL